MPPLAKATLHGAFDFSFIWKYSRRDQLVLLVLTLITFPILYITLELPKRIINDAIGAETDVIDVFGMSFSQVQFLMVLCFAYLFSVLIHGLMKMRLNTMKGCWQSGYCVASAIS